MASGSKAVTRSVVKSVAASRVLDNSVSGPDATSAGGAVYAGKQSRLELRDADVDGTFAGGHREGGGNGNDTSAGQSANTADIESAAPMGIALYLQTVSQHADAQVVCDDASNATDETVSEFIGPPMSEQVSESNNALVETNVAITVDDANSVADIIAAIDLDHNGEPDICQLRDGDLDLNGVIDNIDMGILFDMIGVESLHGIGDMDANGVIDSSDMGLLLLKIE